MTQLTTDAIAKAFADAYAEGNEKVAKMIKDQLSPITEELTKSYEMLADAMKSNDKRNGQGEDKLYKSFGEQLVDIARAKKRGLQYSKMKDVQTIGDDSSGGFLVQEDFSNQLESGMFETGIVMSKARTIETSNNMINIQALKEASRKTGYRLGGIVSYWEGEGDEADVTAAKVKRNTITLDKLVGAFKASEEMLEDAPFLETFMTQLFEEEFGFQGDLAMWLGTGAQTPLSVISTDAALNQTVSGTTISIDEVLEMMLKAYKRSRSEFYCNRSLYPILWKLKMNESVYAFNQKGVNGITEDSMMGLSVTEAEQLPYKGSVGSLSLIDFNEYTIFKKKEGMKSSSSIHVDFLKGLETFKFTSRLTGRPNFDESITMFDGNTKASPYVLSSK